MVEKRPSTGTNAPDRRIPTNLPWNHRRGDPMNRCVIHVPVLALALASLAACGGDDERALGTSAGGSPTSGSVGWTGGATTGSGQGGGGGTGGAAPICTPGEQKPCYDGAPETEDVGIC